MGGLEPWNFMTFQKQLGISSSQLTFTPSFFRGVGWNHQPVIVGYIYIYIYIYISGWYRFDFGDFGSTPYIKNWIWKNWFAILLFAILASVRFAAIRFPRGASSCLRGSWHVSIIYIYIYIYIGSIFVYIYYITETDKHTYTHIHINAYVAS